MAGQIADYENTFISGKLDPDMRLLEGIFERDAILRVRRVRLKTGRESHAACALFYLDGMVSSSLINDSIVAPIITAAWESGLQDGRENGCLAGYVEEKILFASETGRASRLSEILRGILYGDTALLIDGSPDALIINSKGWKTRGVEEPADERVLQGPREGFGESVLANLALLRRRLSTPDLCVEGQRIGRRTDTQVYVCYLGTLASPERVKQLKSRLASLDIDGILDTNYIAEQIRDHPSSLFKTSGATERPDIVAARLLEGRIAVFVDGTPVVMTLPYLFSENFQSDEDYYLNYLVSSFARILRYLCFFLALSIPAVYLALITRHQQLIPTMFALSISQARGGIPLSSFTECAALILIFEILKESGARMPQSLGHALSIVGGLVVGQAAVEAKIVSAHMLIAVSLSGIAGLMIPRLKGIVLYGKCGLLLLALAGGIYGYMLGMAAMAVMIFSLSSFGVDYTISLRDPSAAGLKDILWRAPWSKMTTRPLFNSNKRRAKRRRWSR